MASQLPAGVSIGAKKAEGLRRPEAVALLVALIAGAVAWASYVGAMARVPVPRNGPEAAKITFGNQLGAIGGLILALLITPGIRDPRVTLALASLALVFGASAPWLEQILPAQGFLHEFAVTCHDTVGPPVFSFGVALLVKAATKVPK